MSEYTRFDIWAENYDDSVKNKKGYPFEGYSDVLNKMRDAIAPVESLEILDIGIGTGNLSYELYKQGAGIYGLDFSKRMLELAGDKMPDAKFYEYDFNNDFPAEIINKKFDYIISSYAFHHLNDDAKLNLIVRLKYLLKKNGKVIIGDICFPTKKSHDECKKSAGELWDDEEFYIVAGSFLPMLRESGLRCEYIIVSRCAGVIIID